MFGAVLETPVKVIVEGGGMKDIPRLVAVLAIGVLALSCEPVPSAPSVGQKTADDNGVVQAQAVPGVPPPNGGTTTAGPAGSTTAWPPTSTNAGPAGSTTAWPPNSTNAGPGSTN